MIHRAVHGVPSRPVRKEVDASATAPLVPVATTVTGYRVWGCRSPPYRVPIWSVVVVAQSPTSTRADASASPGVSDASAKAMRRAPP